MSKGVVSTSEEMSRLAKAEINALLTGSEFSGFSIKRAEKPSEETASKFVSPYLNEPSFVGLCSARAIVDILNDISSYVNEYADGSIHCTGEEKALEFIHALAKQFGNIVNEQLGREIRY